MLLFLKRYGNTPAASSVYFKVVNPDSLNAGLVHFDRHFNPDLATDSLYFKSLHGFMSCVEKNASRDLSEAEQEKVCAKEFTQLRLRSFDTQLMYHNVNRKHFQKELALFKHESPY